jgi:glutamate-1-semialdehyde 2,1-aminomutase
MLAMRIVRAYTGRPKILRFEGHYHGWHDHAMVGMAAPFDLPATGGMPDGISENTLVIPANDLEVLEQSLAKHGQEIAAVIVEPSGASWNTVPFIPGFLSQLRKLTEQYNVLLIFDEVITGFRWSPSGAQGPLGIKPDLTTMAKIMAGGMPGAAVGGRADIFDGILLRTGPASKEMTGRVFHAGTFSAHALTAAAGIAAMKLLATGEYQDNANRLAAKLREGMTQSILDRKVQGCCYGEASTFHVYFGDAVDWSSGMPVLGTYDAVTLKGIPDQVIVRFQQALQNRGVDILSFNGGMVSGVHTDEDIDRTIVAFDGALRDLLDEELIARR